MNTEETHIAEAMADLDNKLAELSPYARRQAAERRLAEVRPALNAARETLAGVAHRYEREPVRYGAALAAMRDRVQELQNQIATQERIVKDADE